MRVSARDPEKPPSDASQCRRQHSGTSYGVQDDDKTIGKEPFNGRELLLRLANPEIVAAVQSAVESPSPADRITSCR
jgi:hypothetical protein